MDAQPDDVRAVAEEELRRCDELVAYLEDKIVRLELVNERLQNAVSSARRIGVAIGIVMSAEGISEEAACAVLIEKSESDDRKLQLTADDVAATGSI